ncbi:MAG: DUF5694 domain-containing protein [Bacteroidota bacterium]
MKKSILINCIILYLFSALQCYSQKKFDVMILGTFHMNVPKRDVFNIAVYNILGERRQQEIAELIEQLKEYKPNKIALEVPFNNNYMLSRFEEYINNKYKLTDDERDQIGLRLAKNLGHKTIYAIDYKEDLPINEAIAWAEQNGQVYLVDEIMFSFRNKFFSLFNPDSIETKSINEIFYLINSPPFDNINHSIYLMSLNIGKDDKYIGADFAAKWYARNLKITSNILRIAKDGDKILVLIGAGHAKLLKEYLSQIPGANVVSSLHFLHQPSK